MIHKQIKLEIKKRVSFVCFRFLINFQIDFYLKKGWAKKKEREKRKKCIHGKYELKK